MSASSRMPPPVASSTSTVRSSAFRSSSKPSGSSSRSGRNVAISSTPKRLAFSTAAAPFGAKYPGGPVSVAVYPMSTIVSRYVSGPIRSGRSMVISQIPQETGAVAILIKPSSLSALRGSHARRART